MEIKSNNGDQAPLNNGENDKYNIPFVNNFVEVHPEFNREDVVKSYDDRMKIGKELRMNLIITSVLIFLSMVLPIAGKISAYSLLGFGMVLISIPILVLILSLKSFNKHYMNQDIYLRISGLIQFGLIYWYLESIKNNPYYRYIEDKDLTFGFIFAFAAMILTFFTASQSRFFYKFDFIKDLAYKEQRKVEIQQEIDLLNQSKIYNFRITCKEPMRGKTEVSYFFSIIFYSLSVVFPVARINGSKISAFNVELLELVAITISFLILTESFAIYIYKNNSDVSGWVWLSPAIKSILIIGYLAKFEGLDWAIGIFFSLIATVLAFGIGPKSKKAFQYNPYVEFNLGKMQYKKNVNNKPLLSHSSKRIILKSLSKLL